MKTYRCNEIAQLAHELTLSPLRHLPRQVAGIKRLIDLVESDREYPYALICFHITGFRPRHGGDSLLGGGDLVPDLIETLDTLTSARPLPVEFKGGRLYDQEELARRFRVSGKTIGRWRKRGLAGCWYALPGGKPRLAFTARDVERFIVRHQEMIRRGASFQLMTRQEKERIITRARELVASERLSLHATTLRLAEETGRAVETIRYTLRRYDQEFPDTALFDVAERPQEIDEFTVIYQAYVAGDSISDLAQRLGKREAEIRRILIAVRAKELLVTPIDYIYNELFDVPDAEQRIMSGTLASAGADQAPDGLLSRSPTGLPGYLQSLYRTRLLTQDEEGTLFRRMNFLLHQAEMCRQRLPQDATEVRGALVAEIDLILEQARETKNRIVQANLRLVVSIARLHARSAGEATLYELISDGNLVLMRAVDKFDFARGFRFSTYASWAIKRCFARTVPEALSHAGRYQTGCDEWLATTRDHRETEAPAASHLGEAARAALARSLSLLESRERRIVERRYGLGAEGSTKTLDEIGRELGISKERVRQLEHRALGKLRSSLGEGVAELLAG